MKNIRTVARDALEKQIPKKSMITIEKTKHHNCMACRNKMSDYQITFGERGTCQNYITLCEDCYAELRSYFANNLEGGADDIKRR